MKSIDCKEISPTTNEQSENKENNMSSSNIYKTPSKKVVKNSKPQSSKKKIDKTLNNDRHDGEISSETQKENQEGRRRSSRKITPNRLYDTEKSEKHDYKMRRRYKAAVEITSSEEEEDEDEEKCSESENATDIIKESKKSAQLFEDEIDVEGRQIFYFNTPKKRDAMALAAMNTPKSLQNTPKTPTRNRNDLKTPDSKRKKSTEIMPKTPRHVRKRIKEELLKLACESSNSDFSADESEYSPNSSEGEESNTTEYESENEKEETTNSRQKSCKSISAPISNRIVTRRSAIGKKTEEYVPESDEYFTSHASSKIVTSDHTLDRLKNPRLPADRLLSLLASMKVSQEHEKTISSMMREYKTYFNKWLYILNEGYNILLHGLGSKRNLLQKFHREILAEQIVLVINGFFPSLTIKDILDSITNEILELTTTPSNLHEIVDLIEEELNSMPEIHIFLIVHNIDGAMLRNSKSQDILSRLAKISNIHLLASIDHINTPLLWDHTKLSYYNFSWWDVTTMIPYTDETAFENSLLIQNSGELALSSMRNVFQSLTTNARGIYMLIVKYQLKNKGNFNYQGMPFKGLYSGCREAFLVSSDLALRAQLTEFLDHKLVKSKRSIDGTELLYIPIESSLLQQFIEQQE